MAIAVQMLAVDVFARDLKIDDFNAQSANPAGWQIVNDGVMGGLSKAALDWTAAGTVNFRGVLSLENQGGFSSFRSGEMPIDLSRTSGIALRVRGDGRTYQMRLTSDARVGNRRVAFMAPFPTKNGEWTVVRIPFSAFRGTWRGDPVNDAVLNPARVDGFGIQLSDGRAGPFQLEIDWIKSFQN